MNPEITTCIEKLTPQDWQISICNQVRQVIHEVIPDVQERLQYGKPHFLKNGKYVAVLGPAKGRVSFTLFNAANIEAPDGLFEPSDVADRRTIKFKADQNVDAELLTKLVSAAVGAL